MTLFAILTLFPEALEPYLRSGVLGVAQEKGLAQIRLVDFRDWARDRHRSVDERPFGGGPGMVLRPEPIVECVEWLERRHGEFKRLVMCPGGTPFVQSSAEELAREERVLLLCGRYEGFDERIFELLALEPVSVGDFVLAGGELAALAVTEATVRLLKGVLGNERSAIEESFRTEGGPERGRCGPAGLDHPHYTRPRTYRGRCVPEVLLTGDHASIERWRRSAARARTERRRPDLGAGSPERTGSTKSPNEEPER